MASADSPVQWLIRPRREWGPRRSRPRVRVRPAWVRRPCALDPHRVRGPQPGVVQLRSSARAPRPALVAGGGGGRRGGRSRDRHGDAAHPDVRHSGLGRRVGHRNDRGIDHVGRRLGGDLGSVAHLATRHDGRHGWTHRTESRTSANHPNANPPNGNLRTAMLPDERHRIGNHPDEAHRHASLPHGNLRRAIHPIEVRLIEVRRIAGLPNQPPVTLRLATRCLEHHPAVTRPIAATTNGEGELSQTWSERGYVIRSTNVLSRRDLRAREL